MVSDPAKSSEVTSATAVAIAAAADATAVVLTLCRLSAFANDLESLVADEESIHICDGCVSVFRFRVAYKSWRGNTCVWVVI